MGAPALVRNADIAVVLREIADLLEIKGGNPFRIRAYRNLARTLDALGPSVQTMLAEQRDLDELPGVGPDLAGKLAEIVHTGSCALREQLLGELPAGLHTLLSIPGLGPRKVMALYRELGIHNLDQLAAAARDGSLCAVRGFGERAARRILDSLRQRQSKSTRFTLDVAGAVAAPLLAWLREGVPDAVAEVAGSLRRRQETVGDIDIVAHARHPAALIERFVQFPGVRTVLAHGGTRASVLLRQGLQADLRVVPAASYGAALHYFTGSKSHNIVLRRLAQERGWKLNEYGLFQGEQRIAGATEHSIFAALDLDPIAPELRENRGEFDAARAHRLPRLVTRRDLRGDLHAHAGGDPRALAVAARAQGLSYLALTERGMGADALERQRVALERLNAELDGITLLHGAEVDILPDGSLGLPDEVLARLDLVVGAVQSEFSLPRAEQTTRILRAMDHPSFTILAHPTGRLLLERAPCDLDLAAVLHHARRRGRCIEVNGQPNRLDLDDIWCRLARDEGVTLCIDSDARGGAGLACLDYGIGQARRGWVERGQVLNALPLQALRQRLQAMRVSVDLEQTT